VNLIPSALHAHFRAVAGVSPIQYQKRLRLEEARRLLLTEATSAEAVVYAVGYASASQFSREYARRRIPLPQSKSGCSPADQRFAHAA
jgi:transcriptional regulator GlxA family with amidase domain